MLSFDIRSLSEHAVTVDEELSATDPVWEEGDQRPSGSLRITGRLSPAGLGRFYWHGTMTGDVALECRRCLGEASAHVEDEAHFIFAQAEANGVADDPDVFLLDDAAAELDLRPALREEWLLHVPRYALCRDDCQGLCPTCGAELNLASCGCTAVSGDPRWDVLRTLRDRQD